MPPEPITVLFSRDGDCPYHYFVCYEVACYRPLEGETTDRRNDEVFLARPLGSLQVVEAIERRLRERFGDGCLGCTLLSWQRFEEC